MKRREFLLATTAAAVLPLRAFAAGPFELRAQKVAANILPADTYPTSLLQGFNGAVPGPEIRVQLGDTVNVRLVNDLEEGTAVHWHGVRLENSMDGVPILTQEIVDPAASFDYQFTPKDAGTFWYHSHYLSHEQVARGQMGPLVIDEMEGPDVDHDIVAMLSDWRFDPNGVLMDDYGNMHDVAHAGRLGNFAKAFLPNVALRIGERVRLRLINASVDRIFPLGFAGMEGMIVAIDGMPLAAPRSYDGLILAPAQRADIIADVTGRVQIFIPSQPENYALGELIAEGEIARRTVEVPTLPPHSVPSPNEVNRELVLTMQGGAMSRGHAGDNIWAFNDVSDLQNAPFASFERGETAKITLVNETSFAHGIHLHGHHFYEANPDGSLGDLRDTTLVQAGEQRDILCVFDNPGRWMLHCHMLSHSVGGMKTWVYVA